MSSSKNPIFSIGVGVTLALAIGAVAAGIIVQPDSIPVKEKFQYIFASLFLGLSFGHNLGDALVSGGENKKYALLGFFLTIGLLFLGFLFVFQGTSVFTGVIAGALVLFASCFILAHHTGLIENNDSLDKIVGDFANKASIGGLSVIMVSFITKMAFNPELAETVSTSAIAAISVILAFFLLKYREPIYEAIEPLLDELNINTSGHKE